MESANCHQLFNGTQDADITKQSLHQRQHLQSPPCDLVSSNRRVKQSGCCTWVPSGGRWGYMVVLGSFVVHALLGGFNRCYGVIYLQLQSRFDSSAAITAGVGGLATALRLFAAPLATVLSERIGGQLTVFIGGLIFGSGAIGTAFVPDTWCALFTLGGMSGIGGALVYVPSLVIVGHYFTQGRATALGMACCGSGIGVFIWPLVMQAIFNNYGYVGGMVLVGALLLNTMVAGCLYRPVLEVKEEQTEVELQLLRKQNGGEEVDCQQKSTECEMLQEKGVVQHVEELRSVAENKDNRVCSSWFRSIAQHIHLNLLADRPYLSFFIAQVFCSACYWPAQVLLPALVTSSGYDSPMAIFMLSLMGVTDIVGRLGGGALFDIPWVKRRRRVGYSILLILTSLTVLAWPLSSFSVPLLAVGISLHGLIAGAVVSLKTLMAGDIVGTRLLAGGLGLAVLAQGIGVMTAPPLAGLLRDVTGDYTWSYVFLAALGMFGAIVFCVGAVPPTCRQHGKDDQAGEPL